MRGSPNDPVLLGIRIMLALSLILLTITFALSVMVSLPSVF